jgi:hypothetical protein
MHYLHGTIVLQAYKFHSLLIYSRNGIMIKAMDVKKMDLFCTL